MNAPSVIIQFTQEELGMLLEGVNDAQCRAITEEEDKKFLELEEKLKKYYYDEVSVQFTLDVTVTARPDAPTQEIVDAAIDDLTKRGVPKDALKEFYIYIDGEEV